MNKTGQKNAHLAASRHASDYTLCIYRLKRREFYRSEKGHDYHDNLNSDEIGNWLSAREALWDNIEDNEFSLIHTNKDQYNCFDTENINQELMPQDYIYSAGYGQKSKPIFYLAELDQTNYAK